MALNRNPAILTRAPDRRPKEALHERRRPPIDYTETELKDAIRAKYARGNIVVSYNDLVAEHDRRIGDRQARETFLFSLVVTVATVVNVLIAVLALVRAPAS